ncbi:MAG TPA: hypothetical protein VMT64_09120 [Candidatus Binataceae bacterium]|nr:hypothetical protein [Candidatus Binataceae bacterium]
MTYDIRPLSFGEILDRAFRVYLDNFVLLFGISAIVLIPSGILLAAMPVLGPGIAGGLNVLILLLAGPVMHAALVIAVAEAYLGRPVTIADAYRSVRPIIFPFIGTYLLTALVFVIPGLIFGILIAVSAGVSRGLFVVMLAASVVAAIYFLVCWALIGPVMIVEHRFARTALSRSRALVVDSWWLTVGILITAGLIADIPAAALKFVWGFIPVLGVILTAATQAACSAYSLVALIVYYFDRRCRVEQFDLHLLAEQIRAQAAARAAMAASGSSSLA